VQAVQYGVDGGGATDEASAYRDSAMAVNAEWIAAQSPLGSRILLWAHNGHINKQPGAMGGFLAQYFRADYVTLGTAFHLGTYRAGYNPIFPPGAARDDAGIFPALDSFPGSAEYVFHQTGTPQLILSLGLANANDPASSWLLGELEFRLIGWEQEDGFWEFYPTSGLTPDFDGLIFFDQATGTTGFPNVPMDLEIFAPGTAPCGSLDVTYVRAPSPGNGAPVPLPDGQANLPYTQVLQAGGGMCSLWPNIIPSCLADTWPPYGNWTVTAGALPPGLTLSSDGVLSGTPGEAGSFTFTVQTANSSYPETALGQLQLRIDTHHRDVPVQAGFGCDVPRRRPL